MVEGQSMTSVADVVAQARDGRLEDLVREAVVLVTRELMEAEISAEVGAGLGEVAPESRSTHRSSAWVSVPRPIAGCRVNVHLQRRIAAGDQKANGSERSPWSSGRWRAC
jgi:hypothetical protein